MNDSIIIRHAFHLNSTHKHTKLNTHNKLPSFKNPTIKPLHFLSIPLPKHKMASSSSYNNNNTNTNKNHPFPPNFDPNSIPNTTFVQADPTTFRSVVQQLTGKPKKPSFKLHERRPTARKLEIQLSNGCGPNNTVMVSPVSPLEFMMTAARESPRSPMEEEDKAIAEKGFYLHPISPLSTPRGSEPPELLPLFPLHSPRD